METPSSLLFPAASPSMGEVPAHLLSHAEVHEHVDRRGESCQQAFPQADQDPYRTETERTGWYGYIAFAGIMLVVLGLFHALMGLVALFQEDYYAVGTSGLMLEVDYSGWGWVHLISGVVAACAGFALTRGETWARIVAVVVAVLSMWSTWPSCRRTPSGPSS